MSYLLAGIGLVLLIWAFVWISINAPASRVVRWVRWGMVGFLTLAILGLLAMGFFRPALLPAMLLFPILFPWSRRIKGSFTGRAGGQPQQPQSSGSMTYKEAAEILGVAADAKDDEIKEAHRNLMTANHPDKGGSAWFASQINQARDTMMGN
ncbi:MAG: DnaJ domain-containing protein [Alphaproteobacteria bacterium]|jgi:DnaJ family protein C protein 19